MQLCPVLLAHSSGWNSIVKRRCIMSDAITLNPSKKECFGSLVPKHTAKLITQGIEDNSLPLLPNKDGKIEVQPIYNANNGWVLNAKDLVPAQITRSKDGYQSNLVATKTSIEKAGTRVKADERGLFYNFKNKEGKFCHSQYFFAEQLEQPDRIVERAKIRQPNNLQNETLKIDSAENYLPMYIAACKSGASLEVSPEVAEQFKQNISAVCKNELAKNVEKTQGMPSLSEFLYNADVKANEIVKSVEKEKGLAPQQKKDERKINRSESMTY